MNGLSESYLGTNKITMAGLRKLHETGAEGRLMVAELLRRAFEEVSDEVDVRGPINKTIQPRYSVYENEVIAYAIEFMTATKATVVSDVRGHETFVTFIADGYRKGPAGDH